VRFNLIYFFYFSLFILCLLTISFETTDVDEIKRKTRQSQAPQSRFSRAFLSTFKPERNSLHLYSDEIIDHGGQNKIYLKKPKGNLGPIRETFFVGHTGVVDKIKSELLVSKDVIIRQANGSTKADQLNFNYKNNTAIVSGNVVSVLIKPEKKVNISSRELTISDSVGVFTYLGLVSGEIKDLTNNRYGNIQFKSDLLTYNDIQKRIFLEGNAFIKREKSKIWALSGSIWLNNQGAGVKYFTMDDDVKLKDEFVSSTGDLIIRNSISEKIEGFAAEEKLVLSGFPQVEQDGDIIKGNEMIIREDQEMIEIINTNSQFKLNGRKN